MNEKISKVIRYIKTLPDFSIVETCDGKYNHIGATITDAVLQAGIDYETVVRPRIQRLIKEYPEAKTTTEFLKLFRRIGAKRLLEWDNKEKPNRILGITHFFVKENIETEKELKSWLKNKSNIRKLKKLRGIGNKTVDYFKILVGIPTSAVDRHLAGFLKQAGVKVNSYQEAKEIIDSVAEQLGANKALFDHSIWRYMSNKSRKSKRNQKICKKFNRCHKKMIIKGEIISSERGEYARLKISEQYMELFKGIKKIKVIYEDSFDRQLNPTFWRYGEINSKKIQRWSNNQRSIVEIDISNINSGVIRIVKIEKCRD
jgi:thermostable 8-oxoguanine DNA glycosylase